MRTLRLRRLRAGTTLSYEGEDGYTTVTGRPISGYHADWCEIDRTFLIDHENGFADRSVTVTRSYTVTQRVYQRGVRGVSFSRSFGRRT